MTDDELLATLREALEAAAGGGGMSEPRATYHRGGVRLVVCDRDDKAAKVLTDDEIEAAHDRVASSCLSWLVCREAAA